MSKWGNVCESQVSGAPEKYRVKLSDPCQQCDATALIPKEIRSGLFNLKLVTVNVVCQDCNYVQKDLSFVHMS